MTALPHPIFTNPSALTYTSTPSEAQTSNRIYNFHKSLPSYSNPTPLSVIPKFTNPLPLNLKNIFLKDESIRFTDLPSFKPLGLAWAIRNGIIAELEEESPCSIPGDISVPDFATKAKEANIKLIAASDGNLGRSVARLGKLFGVEGIFTRIFIPGDAEAWVSESVKQEGVEVIEVEGGLEDAMREGVLHSVATDGVFVDLEEVEGWEDIPRWIVEGYSTVFKELDEQLDGENPDLVIVPVGVGGLAQAAVTHYKSSKLSTKRTRVLAVEPENAAALHASLQKGERISVETKEGGTIMKNLNYGTVAEGAWEVLRGGLDASVVVGDREVEDAMVELRGAGFEVGLGGGAVLAGLRAVLKDGGGDLGLSEESTVVLIGTEGVK